MEHPGTEAMAKLVQIAENIMGFETTEVRNRDSLDFVEVHVAAAERSLIAAYQVGVQTAVDEMKALMKEEQDDAVS